MSDSLIEMAVNLTEKERLEAERLYPGPTEFVHLHNHTIYSQLDGLATPEEYFSACSHLGHPAFSITDHGSMAAIPDAYWSAKKHKVAFLPGCEVYFCEKHLELVNLQTNDDFKITALRPDYSKDVFTLEDLVGEETYQDYRTNRHLTVIAMDMVGYRNLLHMTTEAWEIGLYYKPRVWFERIAKYHEGLIVLSGCLNGPVCHALRKATFWTKVANGSISDVERSISSQKRIIKLAITQDEATKRAKKYYNDAITWIKRFRDLMGDRFYLELQMPGDEIPFAKEAFNWLNKLSKQFGVKSICSNDCHLHSRNDFKTQKCMLAIEQGVQIDDPNLFFVDSDEQFFKSRAQLRKSFSESGYNKYATNEEFETICDNTVELAKRCKPFDPDLGPKLPQLPNADEQLRVLTYESLRQKGLYNDQTKHKVDGKWVTYKEQADIELNRYIEKGFASYFLIVRDLLNFSKSKGWDVGPGRGSCGGSLVSYLLSIHQLDPLAWGLSSIRFMGDSRGGNMLKVTMD